MAVDDALKARFLRLPKDVLAHLLAVVWTGIPDGEAALQRITEACAAARADARERAAVALADDSPEVIRLPLTGGGEAVIRQRLVTELAPLYPAVNIPAQLRAMRGWLLANPTRRKTSRGILRFVTNWLAREQDRGDRGPIGSTDRETARRDRAGALLARIGNGPAD
jgi:hypothetical protein